MVDALADVQPMPRGDAGSLLRQFENLQARVCRLGPVER